MGYFGSMLVIGLVIVVGFSLWAGLLGWLNERAEMATNAHHRASGRVPVGQILAREGR